MRIGILHPGAMGAVLAGEANASVMWASEGRSPETRDRARAYGLTDTGTMSDLVEASEMLISVCPPYAAADVARRVEQLGFGGVYVDANAVAPATVREIATRFARFVDGGIIGPPPTEPGLTRLYLAGPEAETVAAVWHGSNVDTRTLEGGIGSASALKAAYAGWTKGSAALLLAVRAYAEANGLGKEIVSEWETSIPGLAERADGTASRIGRKAWRFEGEMAEIAAAMEDLGLPSGFHEAAREVYHRLSDLKGVDQQSVEEVSRRILGV